MCGMGVDLDEIALMHDVAAETFDDDLTRLASLEADGIVTREGRRLTVTEEGRPLVRAVCAVFDEYLGQGAAPAFEGGLTPLAPSCEIAANMASAARARVPRARSRVPARRPRPRRRPSRILSRFRR